jgi:hypothetical protein
MLGAIGRNNGDLDDAEAPCVRIPMNSAGDSD